MTKLKKSNILRPAALNGKAYEIIKRALLQGEIEGGAFLSQDVVMRKYGIGRTPFREACNRLQHEQLLGAVSRIGYMVPKNSSRSLREIFEVHVILQRVVAELAAARATSEEVKELDEVTHRMISLEKSTNSYEEVVRANTPFHLCLARMAHNQELVRLVTSILKRTQRLCRRGGKSE